MKIEIKRTKDQFITCNVCSAKVKVAVEFDNTLNHHVCQSCLVAALILIEEGLDSGLKR